MSELFNKVKRTMSKYELSADDNTDKEIREIIKELKPIFIKNILDKLPSITEIKIESANLPEITSYSNGIADGAIKIINKIKEL